MLNKHGNEQWIQNLFICITNANYDVALLLAIRKTNIVKQDHIELLNEILWISFILQEFKALIQIYIIFMNNLARVFKYNLLKTFFILPK